MFGEKWFSIIITQYKKSGECISIDFMIHAMILLYTHLSFTVLLWMMQSHIMYNFFDVPLGVKGTNKETV